MALNRTKVKDAKSGESALTPAQLVNLALYELADHVTPNQELLQRWETKINTLIGQVVSQLPKEYVIDRHAICGSMAKKTAVLQPDCDCILFINQKSWKDVKKINRMIKSILENTKNFIIRNINCLGRMVQFKVDHEIDVDLLLACNKLPNSRNTGNADLAHLQRLRILEILASKLEAEQNKKIEYFSSLSESQVQFMRGQSPFVNTMAKLLKYYYKCLAPDRTYVTPGLKYMIEIMTVYFGQEQERIAISQNKKPSILAAFHSFFEMFSKEESIKILFENFQSVPKERIEKLIRGTEASTETFTVPKFILERGTFVIDPVNPFNDVLKGVKDRECFNHDDVALEALECQAQDSLSNVDQLLNQDQFDASHIKEWIFSFFGPDEALDYQTNNFFEFSTVFTYFSDWENYMKATHLYKIEYQVPEAESIETDFRASVPMASFRLLDGNYSSPEEFQLKLNQFQKTLFKLMNQRRFIGEGQNYIGADENGPAIVLPYEPIGIERVGSFVQKVIELEDEYGLAFVGVSCHPLKYPAPCLVPGEMYGSQVFYACCILLFANVHVWKGERRSTAGFKLAEELSTNHGGCTIQ